MLRFAQTCAAVAAASGRLEKIALLAAYLRALDADDLAAAARFFTGDPLGGAGAARVGWRTIVRAAARAWSFGEESLRAAYRRTGDLGSALGPLLTEPTAPGLFPEELGPASFAALLQTAAQASGPAAGRTREAIAERLLRACRDPLEATYAIKVLTGELRIGLREGLVLDAIAQAFGRAPEGVRRAMMASGDAGAVALAARAGALEAIRVGYGHPIAFMLATPLRYGSEYRELADGAWFVEEKYDGVRAQLHCSRDGTRIFSRTGNDVTASYPEIAAAASALPGDVILDGEIVAHGAGRVLPFRELQSRLQRKTVDDALLRSIPAVFMAFDVIAVGQRLFIDEPLAERRTALKAALSASASIRIAPAAALGEATAAALHERFAAARAAGHEGLVLKRLDSPYAPGRRGKWWYKLKRELATLDVAVTFVEWGNGKRAGVLSDYTFAVRAPGERLLTIGKAYSGLTDDEIAALTRRFMELALVDPLTHRGRIPVAPQVVLEVAFDVIAPSDLHESGYALRFPRIVRVRDDKPASEIDTLADVERIYAQMLRREGGD